MSVLKNKIYSMVSLAKIRFEIIIQHSEIKKMAFTVTFWIFSLFFTLLSFLLLRNFTIFSDLPFSSCCFFSFSQKSLQCIPCLFLSLSSPPQLLSEKNLFLIFLVTSSLNLLISIPQVFGLSP